MPQSASSTVSSFGGVVYHQKTFTQQTQITHTEKTHTRHVQTFQNAPQPVIIKDPSPDDIADQYLAFQKDSRRLSLSQINHSHKSPFSCPESALVKSRSSSHCDSGSFNRDPSLLHNYFDMGDEVSPEKEKNYFKPISDLLNDSNDTIKLEADARDFEELNQNTANDCLVDDHEKASQTNQTSVKVSVEDPSVEDIVRSFEMEIESLVDQQKLYSSSLNTVLDEIQPSHSDSTVGSFAQNTDLPQNMKPLSTAPPVMVEHSTVDLTDLKKVETAPAVISTQYLSDRMIKPSLTTKNEPVVFRFDFTSENNLAVNKYLAAPNDNEPPLSAKTQYSSPAYAEPFDTLIGHMQGVSQTQGAIHVNDFIRSKLQNTLHQQRLDMPGPASEKKAAASRTHTNSKRTNLCKPGHIRPAGALDSSLTANPHYKVSLEEIPLTPNSFQSTGHSPSQHMFTKDRQQTLVQPLSFVDGRPVNHSKPPHGTSHPNARKPKHSKPVLPHMVPDPGQPPKVIQRQNSGCNQFPLNNRGTSDCSTAEDVLSKLCPELIFTPIKSLTQKNVHRISDYDNCGGGMSCHLGRPVSSHRSGGTHYSQPWDSTNLWKQLLAYKHTSQVRPAGDEASCCNESDVQSILGSDVACSTFEWKKKTTQAVTLEKQTRLESRQDVMEEHAESSVEESLIKEQDLVEEMLQCKCFDLWHYLGTLAVL